jgi:hypothetical protein
VLHVLSCVCGCCCNKLFFYFNAKCAMHAFQKHNYIFNKKTHATTFIFLLITLVIAQIYANQSSNILTFRTKFLVEN